ncbi:MAG: putative Ig domain-containing protein [Nitrospirae bacterium]|nr:putative Ig domain-containing protein [Nitrospirota bacterium]
MNRQKNILLSLLTVFFALAQASVYGAQMAPVSGEIEQIYINNAGDHWSGGEIVVGGQHVILPRNLLIDLPANRLTLKQLFDQAPASCVTAGESGLAKGDSCNTSGAGGIATISANITNNGDVIAGDVLIDKGIEAVTGRVSYIDYADGYFRINGILNDPTTGVMVRLNDPTGRHTVQQGLGCAAGAPNCSPDPRFTLDPDNYTNTFSTGYPFCIPSTTQRAFTDVLQLGTTTAQALADGTGDVLCPVTNRTVNGGAPVDDSRRFAPVMIGDSVTAEGNFETVNGVRFLSTHTIMVGTALTTKTDPAQPDYIFLAEVEVDAPGFQNQRVRTLFIGFATLAPADVLIWSLHRDPVTNEAHEFPLATVSGCDIAAGAGTCGNQGIVGAGANIWKIRHDVDFIQGADAKLDPCAHLRADARMGSGICPLGGTPAEMFSVLSPIPHEIQARTGHSLANPGLITIDIAGNEATNGQYLFPFGMNLGGVSTPEMVEIDLNALAIPFSFSGIPWNLDRRLSPGGCNGPCEAAPQPLDPFPFEGPNMDPRTLASVPQGAYNDPNFTNTSLTRASNRILSYVSGTPFQGGKFNFDGDNTLLAWPPADPAAVGIIPTVPLTFACGAPVVNPDAPQIISTPVSSALTGQLYSYQVLATDPNPGDTISYSLDVSPAGMTINSATGSVQWTPSAAQAGVNPVTVRATDQGGLFAAQTFTVTVVVQQSPQPPVITSTPVTTATAGQLFNYQVTASDPNPGDTLTYSLDAAPAGMIIISSTGLLQWAPQAAHAGTHPVTVRVTDTAGLFAVQSFSVTVPIVLHPPAFTSIPVTSVVVGLLYSYQTTAADPNAADVLTFSLDAAPLGMTINNLTGLIEWTPALDQVGPQVVTARVTDAGGLFATQSFSIAVSPLLQAPVITSNPVTNAIAGQPYAYQMTVSDLNATDVPTYSLDAPVPAGMTINSVTGLIQWTPTLAQTGAQAVFARVTDSGGLFSTQSYTVTVGINALNNISGTVVDRNNAALSGVTMTLIGPVNRTVTTTASGGYIFTGLPIGTYEIIPSLTGYRFNPVSKDVTINGVSMIQNFRGESRTR